MNGIWITAMNKMNKWPLMKNNITLSDRLKLAKFVLTSDRFTNGKKVRQFEKEWSNWLGAKHSLYVSSGSTANYLLLSAVKELYGLQNGDKVLNNGIYLGNNHFVGARELNLLKNIFIQL